MFGMSNGLQASIEQEKETKEGRLEDKMLRNIGVDINEDTTNIFQNLLNETHNELYPGWEEMSGYLSVGGTMSSFSRGFDETDAMFLEFAEDLDNLARGLSLVGDNSTGTSQPSATPTPKRRTQSRHLEFEHYVAANGPTFVEHQMLSTFKEFWDDCHRHFKKYSDPVEAHANPPHLLVEVMRIDTTSVTTT
ncbi:gamma-aminobutyrate transaminase POP2 [Cucumis melo var. makuwa]|uniref:Gamma-aminobutyrate transaminase POP2 n=1 Tax=Cucumis melo var. makuwa TaxID=1194695 RepID=A0A5A7VER8_CUCMM|nr:gamma-aminobutyrate transaminase POP2 [Cucumis melo var. makuwa]TYK26180.1 gamma-aminobutyrate transaminase POP2 [Cucumis melo var. makuwa]